MKGLVGLSKCEWITYSRLYYASKKCHRRDLNLRPTDPEADTLTTQSPRYGEWYVQWKVDWELNTPRALLNRSSSSHIVSEHALYTASYLWIRWAFIVFYFFITLGNENRLKERHQKQCINLNNHVSDDLQQCKVRAVSRRYTCMRAEWSVYLYRIAHGQLRCSERQLTRETYIRSIDKKDSNASALHSSCDLRTRF